VCSSDLSEELGLGEPEKGRPAKDAAVVGFSSLAGSFLPILPFFVLPVQPSMWVSLGAAIATLFVAGAVKARMTIGNWKREGIEIAVIGTAATLVGYAVGALLRVTA
jgi:predicted membrane protein (TIGR00267 family)